MFLLRKYDYSLFYKDKIGAISFHLYLFEVNEREPYYPRLYDDYEFNPTFSLENG
jgi:hypothetical protein